FLRPIGLAGLVFWAGLAPLYADGGSGGNSSPGGSDGGGGGGGLKPLSSVSVPLPGNLGSFVQDKDAAIKLGKALFWDMQVGGDGLQACASCHFQAGADVRNKNQLNPRASAPGAFSPNQSMSAADFPMNSGMVMGSAGLPKTGFLNIVPG